MPSDTGLLVLSVRLLSTSTTTEPDHALFHPTAGDEGTTARAEHVASQESGRLVRWQPLLVLVLWPTLLAARTRTRVLPLLSRSTATGRALGSRGPSAGTLGEEDQGLSLSLKLMVVDPVLVPAARASTLTPSTATTASPKLALPVLRLLDLPRANEASPASVKASEAVAEFARVCQLLLLVLLAQLSLDCMRNIKLRRRLGRYHGRSPGQDQGQCSTASEGETAVGVEAQQVNLF